MKLILKTPTGTKTIGTNIKPENIREMLRRASYIYLHNVRPNYKNLSVTKGKIRIYTQMEHSTRIDQIKYS